MLDAAHHAPHEVPPPAAHEARRGDYLVSDDPARMDADAVHAYLTRSYWAAGISRELVRRAIANSLAVGLRHLPSGEQVGFARAVTDRATFAYLADVYVLESHRGHGLGIFMVETLLAHPELQGLRRLHLVTREAASLYRRFGFTPLAEPGRHMELVRRGLYTSNPQEHQ